MSGLTASIPARVSALWLEREFAVADELLDQSLAVDPHDARLWELKGFTRWRLRDTAATQYAFEMANTLAPLSNSAQCLLASCYLKQGMRESARTILTHLAANPILPENQLPELAANLGQLGEFELALKICRLASQRDPDRDEPVYAMAYYMRKLQYPAATVAAVTLRAHRLDPSSTVYRVALAILYQELGRWEDAYEVVRGIEPHSVPCAHCVRHLLMIFDVANDRSLKDACQRRLDELNCRHPLADSSHFDGTESSGDH